MSRSSSRSHWMEAPATKMEPSRAYSTLPSSPQAMVVTSPFWEKTGSGPRPAWSSTPISPAPSCAGCWTTSPARCHRYFWLPRG